MDTYAVMAELCETHDLKVEDGQVFAAPAGTGVWTAIGPCPDRVTFGAGVIVAGTVPRSVFDPSS